MLRHLMHEPELVWIVMFAFLCTVLSWPANTWRSIVVFLCWLVCLIVLIMRFVV